MTNEELCKAIQAGGDPENKLMMELWDQNGGLIEKVCDKYAGRIEKEDARQECFIAFSIAAKEYDQAGGASFASFCFDRCSWHLYRQAAENGSVCLPEYQRGQVMHYRRFIGQWLKLRGELPDDTVTCFSLNLSIEQLQDLRAALRALEVKSLSFPLSEDPDGGTLGDTLQDPDADTLQAATEQIFEQERRRAVWSAVDSLKPKESEAIRHYFQDGMTHKQIGKIMQRSPGQVRLYISSGFRALRTQKKYRILRDFVDLSPIYSRGISGTGSGTFNRTWTSATEATALHFLKMEERWKQECEELDRKAAKIK